MARKRKYHETLSRSDKTRLALARFKNNGGKVVTIRVEKETVEALQELIADGYGRNQKEVFNRAVMDALNAMMSEYDYDDGDDDVAFG